jgi:hypothetical protein
MRIVQCFDGSSAPLEVRPPPTGPQSNLLQESRSKRIEHGECTPRQIIQLVAICVFCVHLPTFALKTFLYNAADWWLRKC